MTDREAARLTFPFCEHFTKIPLFACAAERRPRNTTPFFFLWKHHPFLLLVEDSRASNVPLVVIQKKRLVNHENAGFVEDFEILHASRVAQKMGAHAILGGRSKILLEE